MKALRKKTNKKKYAATALTVASLLSSTMSFGFFGLNVFAEEPFNEVINEAAHNDNNIETIEEQNEINDSANISEVTEHEKATTVNSILFDKSNAVPGDTVKITVDIADVSSIDFLNIILYTQGDEGHFVPIKGNIEIVPDKTGKLTADIKIDNSFKNGTYKVLELATVDVHGIESFYNEDDFISENISLGEFIVSNSPESYEAPKLKSVMFDKTSYRIGERGKIVAELEDSKLSADAVEVVYGFITPDGTMYKRFVVRLIPTSNGVFEGEFIAPEYVYPTGLFLPEPIFHVSDILVLNGNDIRHYDYFDSITDPLTNEEAPGENNISNLKNNFFDVAIIKSEINENDTIPDKTEASSETPDDNSKVSVEDDKTDSIINDVPIEEEAKALKSAEIDDSANTQHNTSNTTNAAPTGDNDALFTWSTVAGISAIAGLFTVFFHKKKE